MNALDFVIKLSKVSEVSDLFYLMDEVALDTDTGMFHRVISNMVGRPVTVSAFDDGESSGFSIKLADPQNSKRAVTFNLSEVELVSNERIDEQNHSDAPLVLFNDSASDIPYEPTEVEFFYSYSKAFAALLNRVTTFQF